MMKDLAALIETSHNHDLKSSEQNTIFKYLSPDDYFRFPNSENIHVKKNQSSYYVRIGSIQTFKTGKRTVVIKIQK